MSSLFKLIALLLVVVVAVVVILPVAAMVLGLFIGLFVAMLVLFILAQAVGLPVSVTRDGKKVGYYKHFKFHKV